MTNKTKLFVENLIDFLTKFQNNKLVLAKKNKNKNNKLIVSGPSLENKEYIMNIISNDQITGLLTSVINHKYRFVWTLISEFNYLHPTEGILNVAMPSASSIYFITLLFPNTKYKFQGNFPDEKLCFQCTIALYNDDGNPVKDKDGNFYQLDSNTETKKNIDWEITTPNSGRYWAILRFYINRKLVNVVPADWLFEVYENNRPMPFMPRSDAIYKSTSISKRISKIFSNDNTISSFTPFYIPIPQGNGLFPEPSHFYSACTMGDTIKAIKVSGMNISSIRSPTIVYSDFILVDNTTTATQNGIPFYEFGDTYEFIVCSNDYEYIGPLQKLTWDNTTIPEARVLIFRIIDYQTDSGLPNIVNTSTEDITPEEAEKAMGYYYPKIEIIE